MKHIFYLLSALLIAGLVACNDDKGKETEKVLEELKAQNESQARKLQEYEDAVGLLNETVDSISSQEALIFISQGDGPLTKEDVKMNLLRYEYVLRAQQEKIASLENKIKQNKDTSSSSEATLRLIENLKEEITAKNKKIASLQQELEKKNLDIAALQNQVNTQQTTITTQFQTIQELDLKNKKQGEALARQDAMLNNGYVLIGSKEDLKRKGITKKDKIVAEAALDRSKFAIVDIRTWREISFTAKKPRILTSMPASSYELISNGDNNYTLIINDPSNFWRISNYLVIQSD